MIDELIKLWSEFEVETKENRKLKECWSCRDEKVECECYRKALFYDFMVWLQTERSQD